jgi:hypothetical protein
MKKRTQVMPPLSKEALFIFRYYYIEISKKIWLILCKSYSTIWPDCGIRKKELTFRSAHFFHDFDITRSIVVRIKINYYE